MIFRAYKTELDPTCKQVQQLLRHAGAARWAYNWGLRRKIESYKDTGKSPSAVDLHRELNKLKKKPLDEGGVPWMYESSKCAPQEALRNLDRAYSNFFRRCKIGAKKKGFPKFKSRKKGIGSFRLTGTIHAFESSVWLPSLGEIRLKERGYMPADGVRVLAATVSENAGRWFVSLQAEQHALEPGSRPYHIVGVDVGIRHLAVTSDGKVYDNPRALTKTQRTLRVRQKAVSRKIKGSNNRRKAAVRVARVHYRVVCIRRDAIHKMTTAITKLASVVVVEDLNVSGMLSNHRLALALSDASLSEIHRQLAYKSKWYGVTLLKAGRFYPSSKRCSKCGHVKETLSLDERTYHCESKGCGHVMDRDLNASINLKLWPQVAAATACCPGSAGRSREASTKLLVGQEPSRKDFAYG
jgi:putative transposase